MTERLNKISSHLESKVAILTSRSRISAGAFPRLAPKPHSRFFLFLVCVLCNPTTQARDVREFINSNYIMGKVQPIDMFPHTHHIECVITLDKKND